MNTTQNAKQSINSEREFQLEAGDDTILYKGKKLKLSEPARTTYGVNRDLVGREQELIYIRNAWLERPGKPPRSPLLYGKPGVGKNQLVYDIARRTGKDLYILNGHEDISPDKLSCGFFTESPQQKIEYILTPLTSAMLTGGICFIDEISELQPGTMNVLVSLLDERRYIDSQPLGNTRLEAAPGFRFIAATNTSDIDPVNFTEKIWSRLDPIHVGPQGRDEIDVIINRHFHRDMKAIDPMIRRFWELWHTNSTELPTPREALQIFSAAADLADADNLLIDHAQWSLESSNSYRLSVEHVEQVLGRFFEDQNEYQGFILND